MMRCSVSKILFQKLLNKIVWVLLLSTFRSFGVDDVVGIYIVVIAVAVVVLLTLTLFETRSPRNCEY